jgi:CubicO group peptidase (beta-lactamase class C family)
MIPKNLIRVAVLFVVILFLAADAHHSAGEAAKTAWQPHTRVSIARGKWQINGAVTYRGTRAEGLLMNVRMVNSVFEDANEKTRPPGFDPEANTNNFIAQIPDYAAHGVRAFTLNLQGGDPKYEGAVNSAFNPDGSLRDTYLRRVRRVIEACDQHGIAVILGCFYQRQDQILRDEQAVRAGVINTAKWIRQNGFSNVVLELANEYGHRGYDHKILKTTEGQVELIRLAKRTAPTLLVSTSELGSRQAAYPEPLALVADFLLLHNNNRSNEVIPWQAAALKKFGKPIVVNEDDKVGAPAAQAAELCVANGISWGLMLKAVNQYYPFSFKGAADDPAVYAALRRLTSATEKTEQTAQTYFPPPESQGGWRKLDKPEEIRRLAGMNPDKLAELKEWLLASDQRNFAAVVIRNGYVVLEVERGNSSQTHTGNIKSSAKAICATVLAIASEESQRGRTPKKMKFDDPAFDFIPWAKPLSDPRKAQITVKQLFNHTSGLAPEATGARNAGPWEYVLGHNGDQLTAKLAFEPGTACGYSTHGLYHAALVCEDVTGLPYDEFTIKMLFRPIGVEKWWFEYFEGGDKIGRHPSHALGLPACEMARVAWCMLNGGRWQAQQVIPRWFVAETAAPTHNVQGPELRFKINAQIFSHAWELPARLTGEGGRSGAGIPADARYKPGSGGQLIAFVPSLNLVITRQTGGSGAWEYEEYLRRACQAVIP